MKFIYLSISLFLMAFGANAQRKPLSSNHKDSLHQQLVTSLLKQQSLQTANKTTSITNERLKRSSMYYLTGSYSDSPVIYHLQLTDSAYYKYTSAHHSKFNYNDMLFDNNNGLSVTSTSGIAVADNQWDKVYGWQFNNCCWIDSSAVMTITYTADGHIDNSTTRKAGTSTDMMYETDNFFDASGNVYLKYTMQNNYSSVFDTAYMDYYIYDAATGNIILDSIYTKPYGVWNLGYKYKYLYNASDKLSHLIEYTMTSTGWMISNRYDVDYYPTGQLKTVTDYSGYIVAGTLQMNSVDSFGWTPGVDYLTYKSFKCYTADTELNSSDIITRHISADNNLPDTIREIYSYRHFIDIDSFEIAVNKTMNVFTYNSNNNPIQEICFFVDAPLAVSDTYYVRHYYYESYAPEDVNNVATAGMQMLAYPNPVSADLNISFANMRAGSNIQFRLINSLGQCVIDSHSQYNNNIITLSLVSIPTGVYWLVAEDSNTHTTYKQAIMKQ